MIPNGSDLAPAEPTQGLPPRLASLLAQHDGKLKCIFSGAHGIANGLDAVLDAAAELRRRFRDDIVIIFIGNGMKKPALMKRAGQEGLSNCVFLDPVPKSVLVELQRQIDVGLMVLANVPAFYDGTSPNKFFDYLSAGLPVLINYPGWLAEFVVRERCGFAALPADAMAFADALERFADDPDERRQMGLRSRSLAEATFARDRLAAQFVEFIEAVARDQATP
jgi:glycosyltransferase involved in cell wall biosynthesis